MLFTEQNHSRGRSWSQAQQGGHKNGTWKHPKRAAAAAEAEAERKEKGDCNYYKTEPVLSLAISTPERRTLSTPFRTQRDRLLIRSLCICPHLISAPDSPVGSLLPRRRRTFSFFFSPLTFYLFIYFVYLAIYYLLGVQLIIYLAWQADIQIRRGGGGGFRSSWSRLQRVLGFL